MAPLLEPRYRESCVQGVNNVLTYAMELLEQPELLAKARDKNLATLSSLMRHAQTLLSAILPPARAARTVIVVQRGLILAMLSASTFSQQLAGVREINAMLDAASPPPRPVVGPMLSDASAFSQEASDASVEENAKSAVQWLEAENVLSRTLRSHLHLKQYVEQVERIMRFLLRRGCLRDEHLDIVWSITEKQDTFEETKANMFALLAALAVDFSPSQLDRCVCLAWAYNSWPVFLTPAPPFVRSLFARFEHGRDRSAADTIKILGLITALARGDASGVLAKRLTDLLWTQLLAPEAPPEALVTLVDVVNNYAASAPDCRSTIISRCLDNVASGVSVLPSVQLLRHLLVTQPMGDGYTTDGPTLQSLVERQREEVAQLNETRGVVGLLLGELEQYMAAARGAMAAGAVAPPGDGRASHSECLAERLNFLSGLLLAGGIELGTSEVDRVWACLMTGAAQPSDADVLANWLKQIPTAALHGHAAMLSLDAARHVLSTLGSVPPARLTPALWACMPAFAVMVGISAGHMRIPVSAFSDVLPPFNPSSSSKAASMGIPLVLTLEFEGLSRIWDAALEAPSPVCDAAIQWLAWLYPQLSGATATETLSLRQALVCQAEVFLNAAHSKLVAAPAVAAAAKRADNMLRFLDIILAQIDAPHHAARHAARLAPPVHGATYSGRTVTIEYQWAIKAQHYRHYLHAPGNQYGAALRPAIAAGVGVPVDRVRILWAGRELSGPDCAQTPCSKIENAVINVMILPQAAPLQPVAGGVDSDPDTPSMETEATPVTVLQPPVGAVPDDMLSARQLLAAMPGLYDTLYSLADAGHAALCTHATAILNALPTRAETRAHLESLLPAGISGPDLAAAAANSRLQLSSALRAPPAARAYTLQILEGLMIPVNGFVSDAAATAALSAFRALGGPELILSALSPASLPENLGAVPLRSLFLSGLNLLRLVAVDPDAGSFARDLADVDSAADRFAADMVDVLFWLLPRTAMGRLGSSGDAAGTTDAGGDADMAFDDAATNLYALVNGDSQALDPNDVFLTSIGLTLLTHALGQRSGGVMRLLSRPDAANVLSELLLRCPSPALREAAATMCVELVSRENALPPSPSHPAPSTGVAAMSGSGGSGAATAAGAAPLHATGGEDAATAAAVAATRRAMLGMLLTMRAHAEESPTTCRSYFELVSSLLSGCAASGQDGAVLDELLADEVRWLTTAEPCTEPTDCRLEGHLSLVLALVRGLRRRNVVTPAGRSLLTLLLRKFLFPELEFLERGDDEADLDDDAVLLTAVASTPRTRCQAFLLVIALATHDASALSEVLDTLRKLHFDTGDGTLVSEFAPSANWERMQQYTSRRANSFVGLGNGGATCYMNSVFQQLFMQPNIRRNVLSAVDATDAAPADSVLCQLQATFGALHASRLDHHRPESFWQAFKDYDGQPVNVREHQDALEFLTRLQEQVDAAVKPPAVPGAPPPAPDAPAGPTPPLEQVLGGMLVNQIVCRTCPAHRSEKDESFTSLPVDIRNKSGLLESLTSFVQGELLEGDNQWVCEACGRKVDAVKRQTVKTLPQMLCIQLKRFEYDYETMQRLKVKDRFEFPTELDMRPFTREGMDEPADAAPAATPDDKYAYTLMGVVVHSGSAFAGHYYSYIRERVVSPDGTVSAGSWHVFDDKRVEPYDAANLERDTFGGKFCSEGWDHVRKVNTQIEYDRPNSAYMLFYERLGTRDETLRADLAGDVSMDGSAAAAQLAVRLPPSVAAEVRAANAQCVYESHMLSRDYFAFVRGLVDANVEYSRKRRREAPAAVQAELRGGQPAADVLCCELATNFLMFVYSRSATMLREDSVAWLASLTNLLESSRGACCWFLHWLIDPARKNALRMMLSRAVGEDVRELWGKLCFNAIRIAALHHPDVSRYETILELSVRATHRLCTACGSRPPQQEVDLEASDVQIEDLPSLVHALVLLVLEYLEPPAARTRAVKEPHLEAITQILYDYAKLGPVQRMHLVLCEAHLALGDFAVTRLSSYSPPRLDNTGSVGTAVHLTLSLLLRGVVRALAGCGCSFASKDSLVCASFAGRKRLPQEGDRGQPLHAAWRDGLLPAFG